MKYKVTEIKDITENKDRHKGVNIHIEAKQLDGEASVGFNAFLQGAAYEDLEIKVGTPLEIYYKNGQQIVAWDVD